MAEAPKEDRVKELLARSDQLFGEQSRVCTLWQNIADLIFPQRAFFTRMHIPGEDIVEHLTSGYGAMARSELANAIGGVLRPPAQVWFKVGVRGKEETDLDQAALHWLGNATTIQRRAMYDPVAGFARATSEADDDYVAFGNAVITIDDNAYGLEGPALFYQTHHLRDCAFTETYGRKINELHIKCKITARELTQKFRKTCHKNVSDCVANGEPNRLFEIRRVIMPMDHWDEKRGKGRLRFVSVWIDVENSHLLEEAGRSSKRFVVPRWDTTSGSPYAYSPVAIYGLPEVRTLQEQVRTLLEAGEKFVDPPMIAVEEAIRSELALAAGGVTWVDRKYDERSGDPLRSIQQDRRGVPYGMEMVADTRTMVAAAFLLNKITLPQTGHEMTAYEARQRIAEYVRAMTPVFEPIETEYNAEICNETFATIQDNGGFGPPDYVPDTLGRNRELQFYFQNPFTAAREQEGVSQYEMAMGIIGAHSEIKPDEARAVPNTGNMLRDALRATGAPEGWINDERTSMALMEQFAQEQAARAALEQAAAAGGAAEQIGRGVQAIGGDG